EAPKANRSLNNFVESTLMDAMYSEPNEETLAAMKEAESGIELETLELDSFKDYVKSL
ncbi:toxin-antitoxin system protein, partial [Bacteroides stercorirosoris]